MKAIIKTTLIISIFCVLISCGRYKTKSKFTTTIKNIEEKPISNAIRLIIPIVKLPDK